jgi:hypothetical protein
VVALPCTVVGCKHNRNIKQHCHCQHLTPLLHMVLHGCLPRNCWRMSPCHLVMMHVCTGTILFAITQLVPDGINNYGVNWQHSYLHLFYKGSHMYLRRKSVSNSIARRNVHKQAKHVLVATDCSTVRGAQEQGWCMCL